MTLVTEQRVSVAGREMFALTAGEPGPTGLVLLHGWPQNSSSMEGLLRHAGEDGFYAVAPGLPGCGRSAGIRTDGSKVELAKVVGSLLDELGVRRTVVVGHDIGGMVAYSCLRHVPAVRGAVILDVEVPGAHPWEEVIRNPNIWHSGFHAVPALPERLVQGKQREYFDFFIDALTVDPASIPAARREEYCASYRSEGQLSAGFDWYRAFARDARANTAAGDRAPAPVLYLRGAESLALATSSLTLDDYASGLQALGVENVSTGLIGGASHFLGEESPRRTWEAINDFLIDIDFS